VVDTISCAADATSPGEDANVAGIISCAAGDTSPGEDADVAVSNLRRRRHISLVRMQMWQTASATSASSPKNPGEERSDEASESTHNVLSNLKIRVNAIAPSPA